MKTVYQITKKLCGDHGNIQDRPLKAADGTTITVEKDKILRWREHFKQILNRADPSILADIPEAEEDLDISMEPISLHEVKDAISKLKNNKAPGEDGICAEMLKAEEEATPKVLQHILQDIWEKESVPESWRKGIIVKLPKKVILETATIGEELHCCPLQARFTAASFSNESPPQWITYSVRNRQVFAEESLVLTTSLSYVRYLNKHKNGTARCTQFLLTLKKLLTACTENHFGRFSDTMEFHQNWSR